MRKHYRIFLAVVGTVAVLGLSYAAFTRHPTRTFVPPSSRSLIVPKAADECLTVDSWKDSQSNVLFCNGDFGTRTFAGYSQVLKHQVRFYKDSDRKRMEAAYADDGVQVLSGFAKRDDGSLLWEAAPDAQGMIVKTTYWYNGKPFSIEKRALGANIADTLYFHENGNKWARLIGRVGIPFGIAVHRIDRRLDFNEKITSVSVAGTSTELPLSFANEELVNQAQVFNENGVMIVDLQAEPGKRTYTQFYDNGRPRLEQTFTPYKEGDEGGITIGLRLSAMVLHTEDNLALSWELKRGAYGILIGAAETSSDGCHSDITLDYFGAITGERKFDAVGKLVFDGKAYPDRQFTFTKNWMDEPPVPDPLQAWQSAEALHFPHVIVPEPR